MVPLDEARLRRACAANEHIGQSIVVVGTTASTNDLCHEAAKDGSAHGLVIFAEHQTQGRGQQGRLWSAPPGSSLLFSILLRPAPALNHANFITAFAATAIAQCLQQQFHLDPRIKWPNDILVGGRKVCGILAERRQATVVGVGLNVAIRPDEFPEDLRLPATSISTETGTPVDRTELAVYLLQYLDRLYSDAQVSGESPICDLWQQYSEPSIGALIAAATTNGEQLGQLLDLRPDRGLRLKLECGDTIQIQPERLLRIRMVR